MTARFRTGMAGAGRRLALVTLGGAAPAALAHDSLRSSSPDAGSTVAGLDEVSLTFSDALLNLGGIDNAFVIQVIGTGVLTVALGLLVFDLAGGDAGIVRGVALTIKMLAYVGIAPVISVLTAHVPRKPLLVSADVPRAIVVLSLPFGAKRGRFTGHDRLTCTSTDSGIQVAPITVGYSAKNAIGHFPVS